MRPLAHDYVQQRVRHVLQNVARPGAADTFTRVCAKRFFENGAARGIRTPDPVITNDVLYQLSYCGEPCRARAMPAPIRALLISGMARIGKDKRRAKCGSRAPAGPESAPAAGLDLGGAYLFRKFIA